MFTKAKIFNLALGALLLQRQIVNADTDPFNEAKVLNTWWETALNTTLESLDLDSTSTQATLNLIASFDPNAVPLVSQWLFAYQYPTDCAFFRRIQSHYVMDNKSSHIPKRVGIYQGRKVIFTDKCNAIAEYIMNDFPLNTLSMAAGVAISLRLAILSAPLATGKGAAKLVDGLEKKYMMMKAEAQELDRRENFVFESEALMSEFVQTRLSSDSGRGDY